jgi:putative PIN family toxin of toxin-antitoxin system
MGTTALSGPPRVLLDTNCIVSALLFSRGRLAWLRRAWQSGRFVPLVSRATAEELVRVLAYPKFKLDPGEREALLADYLPYTETFRTGNEAPPAGLRDPADAMFISLAQQARADVLVSGNEDILALRETLSVNVIVPARFQAWLESR